MQSEYPVGTRGTMAVHPAVYRRFWARPLVITGPLRARHYQSVDPQTGRRGVIVSAVYEVEIDGCPHCYVRHERIIPLPPDDVRAEPREAEAA